MKNNSKSDGICCILRNCSIYIVLSLISNNIFPKYLRFSFIFSFRELFSNEYIDQFFNIKMIFIFIVLTMSLTFCNSIFLNYLSKSHFITLSNIDLDYFTGLWDDELPDEILEQHNSICQLLINPVIINDSQTLPVGMNTMYWKFEFNKDDIPSLNPEYFQPYEIVFVEKDDHRIKLLPCHRPNINGMQTIYITKLIQYKSLIMLAIRRSSTEISNLQILGFITEFVNVELTERNARHLFISAFENFIQYGEKKKNNKLLKFLNPEFFQLSVENRIVLFGLCASVLRKSIVGVRILWTLTLNVAYVYTDFSSVLSKSEKYGKSPLLYLKVIRCMFVNGFADEHNLIYYLIKHTSNELFVIYDINNKKIIELFKVQDKESTNLIEFAFSRIVNKK